MTLQDDQTNLLCSWDSAVCVGKESDYKTLQSCSEPSPEPEGWPDTAAAPGTEVEGKGGSGAWTTPEGPHLTNTQINFPLRGTAGSWQALPRPTSLLRDSRAKGLSGHISSIPMTITIRHISTTQEEAPAFIFCIINLCDLPVASGRASPCSAYPPLSPCCPSV